MKSKKEIFFNKLQPEGDEVKPLTDQEILELMQEYAEEVLTSFIWDRTGWASKFEANRLAKMFFESEAL